MDRISVIIPSLNSRTVPGVVDALAAQTSAGLIAEILVVGLDEPGVICEDPRVRFVSTEQPVCAAAARNQGLRLAQSDLLVLLDSDCFPVSDWLERLLQRYALGEQVVSGSIWFERTSYWTFADNLSLFHEFMPCQLGGPRRYLPTANLLLTRQVFDQVGDLDESFPGAAGEDIDWTIRMRRDGFRPYFDPAARIVHRPPRAGLRDVLRHFWRSGQNMIRVRWRYRDEYGTPAAAGSALVLLFLSPIIGLWATLRLFRGNTLFLSYIDTLPVVWATKTVWCLGAAWQIWRAGPEDQLRGS